MRGRRAMQLPGLLLLLLAAAAAPAFAARELLQNTRCPPACDVAGGGCIRDTTVGGFRCTKCLSDYIVLRTWGTCGCQRGRYGAGATLGCEDCPVGSFCLGGNTTAPDTNATQLSGPDITACGSGLTTLGVRSTVMLQCVNRPGTYYNSSVPAGVPCPVDTWSAGLKQQSACQPCGAGFTTNGLTGASNSSVCVLLPGYYVKSPGISAICPQGEYAPGLNLATSCTTCVTGATTAAPGASSAANCSSMLPGYYPATLSGTTVTSAQRCPQRHYCPGGPVTEAWSGSGSQPSAAIEACPNGKWTKDVGAISVGECLVPPGHSLADLQAATQIQPCGDGFYRSGWTYGAAACAACGANVASDPTDQLDVLNAAGAVASTLAVRGSSASCYIRRGMGIWLIDGGVYRASVCNASSYGVNAPKVYGLASNPCRDCPSGMQTSAALSNSAAWRDNTTGGFFDPQACVTKKGWGYNGRVASRCGQGAYNDENNYSPCTYCPYGTTTSPEPAADGSSQDSVDDCTIAPGFGLEEGVIKVCPVGSFNDAVRADRTTSCTPCSNGTTTTDEGASGPQASSCNVCAEGWGGTGAGCTGPFLCGGGTGANATFGPSGRNPSQFECRACPEMSGGFSYNWANSANEYRAPSIARTGATSASDCLASFAQLVDAGFYLPSDEDPDTASRQESIEACTAQCTHASACMWITYSYSAPAQLNNCFTYDARGTGSTVVGLKAVPGGDVSPASSKADPTRPAVMASGRYSFYRHDTSFGQVLDTSVRTLASCQEACDLSPVCAGIVFNPMSMAGGAASSCTLVGPGSAMDNGLRSLVRVDVLRLSVASA